MKTKMIRYFALATFAGLMASGRSSAATTVGLELSLLVDVSGSVNTTEWTLQRDGYVNAFKDPTIHALIASLSGGLAVNYVQWSTTASESVGWTHLTNAASSIAFANAIEAAARPSSSNTSGVGTLTDLSGAIDFGTNSINTNLFDGATLVIDVSGDGSDNVGPSGSTQAQRNTALAASRDAALAAGIDRINGLPILGSEANLDTYYQTYLQGGTNSFTLPVNSFDDFSPAIARKIKAEITNTNPVPEGGPGVVGFALAVVGLAGLRYKRAHCAKQS
jgi:hypothetical protein